MSFLLCENLFSACKEDENRYEINRHDKEKHEQKIKKNRLIV